MVADRPVTGASTEPKQVSSWNIANILTGVRILLIPVFVVFIVLDAAEYGAWRWWALVVFVLATITDWLDGALARGLNLVTDFGKIADPIADKLLMAVSLISLSVLGDLTWWITAIILVREIGVTVMRFWVIKYGVIAASPGGKIKTVAQMLGTFILLLPTAHFVHGVWWAGFVVMLIAAALTLWSAIDYVRQAVTLYRNRER